MESKSLVHCMVRNCPSLLPIKRRSARRQVLYLFIEILTCLPPSARLPSPGSPSHELTLTNYPAALFSSPPSALLPPANLPRLTSGLDIPHVSYVPVNPSPRLGMPVHSPRRPSPDLLLARRQRGQLSLHSLSQRQRRLLLQF